MKLTEFLKKYNQGAYPINDAVAHKQAHVDACTALQGLGERYAVVYMNAFDFTPLLTRGREVLDINTNGLSLRANYQGRVLPNGPDIFLSRNVKAPVGLFRDPQTGLYEGCEDI